VNAQTYKSLASIVKNNFTEESHPWVKYTPSGVTKVFIGTFPSKAGNRKQDFFYSSATNRFWDAIAKIANIKRELLNGANGIIEKKKALDKLKLGLTDMGKKVYRQTGSSKDHSLFPLEFIDIIQLIKDRPSIHTLIVSGESTGNSSLSWFNIFCELNNITLDLKKIKKEKATVIQMGGRKIKICKAYSPSRAARAISDDKLLENYTSVIINNK